MNTRPHKRTAPPGDGDAALDQSGMTTATTVAADPDAEHDPRESSPQGSPVSDSVAVLTVRPVRTTRLVVVQCPHCGRRHTHGWPFGDSEVGLRVAHCGRGSYRVQEAS